MSLFQSGAKVCDPAIVTPAEWKQILSLKTSAARMNTFTYIGRRANWRIRSKVGSREN